jgi:hypothetical protein
MQTYEGLPMSLLEEYPLDDIDLDRRVNDVLGVPSVNSYQPDDGPGIRYCKFITLDKDEVTREAGTGRLLEFFVEAKVDSMPLNMDRGYTMDEVKIVSGVMMRRGIGKTESGEQRVVAQYMPEETFIEEFLHDKVAKIRAARWFAEFRGRAAFDEDTLDTVNRSFVPSLDSDRDHFKKVYH